MWALFEDVNFDCILLETHKNMEQMHSIIQSCKKYKYIYINGMFINTNLLKNNVDEENMDEEKNK